MPQNKNKIEKSWQSTYKEISTPVEMTKRNSFLQFKFDYKTQI